MFYTDRIVVHSNRKICGLLHVRKIYKGIFRLIKIKEWVDKNDPGSLIIPFSGAFEYKLVTEYEDPVLRKKFLEDVGVPR